MSARRSSRPAPAAAAPRPCRTSAIRSPPRPRLPPRRWRRNLAATIFAAQVQEHERSAGPWHAEWPTLADAALVTSGALAAIVDIAEGLEIDAERMRANLDATGGLIMAEAVSLALADKIGKSDAHHLVEAASKKAVAEKRTCATCWRPIRRSRASRRRRDCKIVRADGLSGRLAALIDRLLASLERIRRHCRA